MASLGKVVVTRGNIQKHARCELTIRVSRWYRIEQWVGFLLVRLGVWLIGYKRELGDDGNGSSQTT
jgi:hypothetical protein